jgi:hypothetical protein
LRVGAPREREDALAHLALNAERRHGFAGNRNAGRCEERSPEKGGSARHGRGQRQKFSLTAVDKNGAGLTAPRGGQV